MKTAEDWYIEIKTGDHGMFSKETVEAIQRDAIGDSTPHESILQEALKASHSQVRALTEKAERYRVKWLEARKHLRAANKGCERASIALQLAVSRNIRYREITEELQMKLSMETVNREVAAACFHYQANKNEYLQLAHEKSIQENSIQEDHEKEAGEL